MNDHSSSYGMPIEDTASPWNSTRTIRIFLSSTFIDFQAERAALHDTVFPALRRKCEAKGFQFQVVDLRWGVSEEAGKEHKTIDICLEEVRRCQKVSPRPNFLVLIGQRYGWQPPTSKVPDEEFRRLLNSVSNAVDRQLIEDWYRCDENSVPPMWTLRPRQADYGAIEARLRDILLAAAIQTSTPARRLDHYQQSATGLEILVGALDDADAPNADQHVHVITRRIDDLPTDSTNAFIDWDAALSRIDSKAAENLEQLSARLKERLPLDHHWSYRERWIGAPNEGGINPEITHENLDELCVQVLERIGAHINEQIEHATQYSAVDVERFSNAAFAKERCKDLVGRDHALEYVASFLSNESSGSPVLLVHGMSGCGKSALLAGALSQFRDDKLNVLARYIGTTPATSSARSLLNHIFAELGGNQVLPEAEDEARLALTELLTSNPTVVALDAIDQLPKDEARWLLRRLPSPFPASSRLLLSCAEDRLLELKPHLPDHQAYKLPGLEQASAEVLLDTWLAADPRHRRTVTKQQRDTILKGFNQSGGLPLYLRIAATVAREWSSWTIVQPMPDTLPSLIAEFFKNLYLNLGHGSLLSSRALALIAASRQGMAEEELVEILGLDAEVLHEFKVHHPNSPPIKGLPPILWSRLYHDLQTFLSEREAQGRRVLSFFHRQFQDEAAQQWLPASAGQKIHGQIADYFSAQELFLDGAARKQPNARKTAQLPWHLEQAGDSERLYPLLQNFDFVMAICQAGQVEDLIGYYSRLPSGITGELKTWRDFMIGNVHILRRGNLGWPAHKILLQLAAEHADNSPLTLKAEEWLSDGKCDWHWLRNSYRPATLPWNPRLAVIEAHQNPIERVVILSNGQLLSWAQNEDVLIQTDPFTGQILHSYHHQSDYIKGVLELTTGILSWDYSNLYFWCNSQQQGTLKNWRTPVKSVEGALQLLGGEIVAWTNCFLFTVSEETGATIGLFKIDSSDTNHAQISNVGVFDESNLLISFNVRSPLIINVDSKLFTLCKARDGELVEILCKDLALFKSKIPNWNESSYWILDILNRVPLVDFNVEGNNHKIENDILFVCRRGSFPELYYSKNGEPYLISRGGMSDEGMWQLFDGWLPYFSDKFITWIVESDPLHERGPEFGMLKIWDLASGNLLSKLRAHNERISGVIVTRFGDLVSWSPTGNMRLWDGKCNGKTKLLHAHNGPILNVLLIANDNLVSYSEDGAIAIWDITKWKEIDNSKTENHSVSKEKWTGYFAVNDNLILWNMDSIVLWNMKEDVCLIRLLLTSETSGFHGIQKINNDTFVTWKGRKLWLWNSNNLIILVKQTLRIKRDDNSSWRQAITYLKCTREKIIAIRNSQYIFVLNASSLDVTNELTCETDEGFDLAYLTNDNRFIACEKYRAVVWDYLVLEKVSGVARKYEGLVCQNVTPLDDHRFLVWWEKEIYIIDVLKNKEIDNIPVFSTKDSEEYGTLRGVLPLFNGKAILIWFLGKKLKILNLLPEKDEIELIEHNGNVLGAQLSDNELIITYAVDGGIVLWNINTGDCLEKYLNHTGPVSEVKLLENGCMVSFSDHEVIKRSKKIIDNFSGEENCSAYENIIENSAPGVPLLPSHEYISWLSKAGENKYIHGALTSDNLVISSGGAIVRLLSMAPSGWLN